MKQLTLFIAFLSLGLMVQAQSYSIVYVTGNKVLKTGKINKYPLTIASKEAVYVEDEKDKIIYLKGPIKLKKKDLQIRFNKETGISQTYFAYVVKKMTKKSTTGQHSFGGVSRGEKEMAGIRPINGQMIMDDSIQFIWRTKPGTNKYYFNILDDDESIIFKMAVADTTFTLYYLDAVLSPSHTYSWYVSDLQFGEGESQSFYIPTQDSIRAVKQRFKNFVKSFEQKEAGGMVAIQPDKILAVIGFCMEHDLYEEAVGQTGRLTSADFDLNQLAELRELIYSGKSED